VNTEQTPTLNESGWSESSNIRFFQSLPQKTGGFVGFCHTLDGAGIPQALLAWVGLDRISYLGIACSRRLNLFLADFVSDITPNTISTEIPLDLSIAQGVAEVEINDTVNMPAVGDWLQIRSPVTISNIALLGSYGVVSVIPGFSYTIAVSSFASTTILDGGDARQFTTTTDSRVVTATLPNHFLFTGEVTNVPNPVSVGGITISGNYVVTVLDDNNYTITAAEVATSAQTVSENGGQLAISFYNPASGGTQVDFDALESTLANWGEFLMWCPQSGPVYVWQPETGYTSPAVDVITAPQSNTVIFIANQQQMLFCCGTVNLATGVFDPMLIRWSNAGDYTDFVPTASNQAGSFRLILGSRIVGALSFAGGNLAWTDLALYSMQYLQPPLVWGFKPIGTNCGLIGPHAFGTIGQDLLWMSQKQFYFLASGTPQILQCSVWDRVFKNLDLANAASITCETNAFFNEVSWEVPQIDGTTTRARMRLDTREWDYTVLPSGNFLPRTAWTDQSIFGPPLAADPTGQIWQHEIENDAGTDPLL
jgi:hypothetical protein